MPLLKINLPQEGKALVAVGQKVAPGDPIFQREGVSRKSLNLARLLKVKPHQVKNLLVKKIGEDITTGEIIAQKSSLFTNLKIKSPISGLLEKLDSQTGSLTISSPDENLVTKASLAGSVKEIRKDNDGNREIIIEVEGTEIEAKFGVGAKREGELIVLEAHGADLADLTCDLKDRVIAAASWNLGTLNKADALGVASILGEEFEDEDFFKTGDKSGLSISGIKNRNLVVLVFSSENFKKVLKYKNRHVIAWGEGKRLMISNSQ